MKVRTRTTVVTSEGRSSWTRRTMKAPLRRIPARTLLAVATGWLASYRTLGQKPLEILRDE